MEDIVREEGIGKGGERERGEKNSISYTSYSNKWATDTERMAKREKEQGAEIRKRD